MKIDLDVCNFKAEMLHSRLKGVRFYGRDVAFELDVVRT